MCARGGFTCSQFLTDLYRDKVRLVSTPIEPPIDWSTVVAPTESRAFVTFVHPSPHKGLLLFARLADMLGSRRPDIPVLIVQSGQSGGSLNAIPGIDFILLVPSIWDEPFGRVAAEAMINAIPPIVSNRGSLPQVVGGDYSDGGGGRVLSIPEWMTFKATRLPSEQEVEPWYSSVCALWDDPALFHSVAARAHQIAEERYREEVSRKRHLDYFTSLKTWSLPDLKFDRGIADATARAC